MKDCVFIKWRVWWFFMRWGNFYVVKVNVFNIFENKALDKRVSERGVDKIFEEKEVGGE